METQGDRVRRLIERAAEIDRQDGKRRGEVMSERRLGELCRERTGTNSPSPGTVNNWTRSNNIKLKWLRLIAAIFRERYGFSSGWQWLRDGDFAATPQATDPELMQDAIRMIREICAEEQWQVPDESKLIEVACAAHDVALLRGYVDPGEVRRFLKLAIK